VELYNIKEINPPRKLSATFTSQDLGPPPGRQSYLSNAFAESMLLIAAAIVMPWLSIKRER